MQEKQVLVKKKNLAVYDKVSDKIFAGGLPKVTLLFWCDALRKCRGLRECIFLAEYARRGIRILRGKI